MSFKKNSYLYGANSSFIEDLYSSYVKDPASVDASWQSYFASFADDAQNIVANSQAKVTKNASLFHIKRIKNNQSLTTDDSALAIKAAALLQSYAAFGHTLINFDPLKLNPLNPHYSLNIKSYDLDEKQLNQKVNFGTWMNLGNISINEALERMRSIYANKIGLEFAHLENAEKVEWLQNKMLEYSACTDLSREKKLANLNLLLESSYFEDFLHVKFVGAKRFSIEGGESLIVALQEALSYSSSSVEEVVIGMAHRGRLNVLNKILKKPYHAIFSEFAGATAFPQDLGVAGDVKYHLGWSSDTIINDRKMHLTLTQNPSHLEAVNSVVLGRVRAKQDYKQDTKRETVMAVLIHGDAALAGQGNVFESLMSSQLDAYKVGGTLHFVINNQIGFTTDVSCDRFSRYCTDVAKAINAPILHVSGDEVEAVSIASKIAAEYRLKFHEDVFVDIVCYRKYGHNEGDEPMFTQPKMYNVIGKREAHFADHYAKTLMQNSLLTDRQYKSMVDDFKSVLENELEKSKSYVVPKADWFQGIWQNLEPNKNKKMQKVHTGVAEQMIVDAVCALTTIPEGFNLNAKITRQLQAKSEACSKRYGFDWAMGEALAYASLLIEGYNIRLLGQDSERGTFSHRHAVLIDQVNEQKYTPLHNLNASSYGKFEVANSNLAEFSALAFEYGYSFSAPQTLVLWEAQFGDFANGAQVIIDQFIASGEIKWLRASGLVLLLPHGYEGQGPEHSSARLERMLQLCAQDNIQVVNCSTPASFFHVLRRQMHQQYRKPLVVMSPKSLLRHKLATSTMDDFLQNTYFQSVLTDAKINGTDAHRLVLCSGKVYYDLFEEREKLQRKDVALVRIEQLYPFPQEEIKELLQEYKKSQIIWCQEEHANGGAYNFVRSKIEDLMEAVGVVNDKLIYVGRQESASPSAGYMKLHNNELQNFIKQIFNTEI